MKNKIKIAIAFISLFLISGFASLQSQQSFTLKKDIVVAADEVQENVISFGGEIIVEGRVKESVLAFGGNITISGEVGELVLGVGSNIVLKSTAVVKGDVVSLGGSLEKESGCRVDGDTMYFKTSEDVTKLIKDGLKNLFSISLVPLLLIFKLISVFMWFLLALVVAAFFRRQLALASTQIRKSFWPVFGVGLLSIVIFTALAIFSALLSLILIGIPILLALIIIAMVIKIFGRVVLFYFFGESLIAAFGKRKPSAILAVIMGLILVSFITFIPVLGFLFTFVLSIIGWGVVIRTKFGTTENWFSRKN